MDPTKNFDHLDPKLKETYARVMGTTPAGAGNIPQNPPAQSPAAAPTSAVQPVMMNQPQNQFNAAPQNQSFSPAQAPASFQTNPGTGPTVSMPTDTTTIIPPSAIPSNAAPAASSFFSNPSPATTNPSQNPVTTSVENASAPFAQATEPVAAPITPYSPDAQAQYAQPATDQMAQPLPSPSTVAQKGPHEASALLRVLYIIGAVIFFAVYTVFWIKVFNLPFLF